MHFVFSSSSFQHRLSHSSYTLSLSANSNLNALFLQGPEGTVYEGGTFDLSVSIPER